MTNIDTSENTDVLNQSLLNKSRSDKFLLVITLPDVLKSINKDQPEQRSDDHILSESLQFSIWGNVIPSIKVPSINVPFGGQSINVTSMARPIYPDTTVNFNIDNKFNNYWVIWKWLDILNNAKASGYDFENLSELDKNDAGTLGKYSANFSIYGLNEYNQKIIEFVHTACLPTGLGEIIYNYQQSNELVCNFSFSFSQILPKLL